MTSSRVDWLIEAMTIYSKCVPVIFMCKTQKSRYAKEQPPCQAGPKLALGQLKYCHCIKSFQKEVPQRMMSYIQLWLHLLQHSQVLQPHSMLQHLSNLCSMHVGTHMSIKAMTIYSKCVPVLCFCLNHRKRGTHPLPAGMGNWNIAIIFLFLLQSQASSHFRRRCRKEWCLTTSCGCAFCSTIRCYSHISCSSTFTICVPYK